MEAASLEFRRFSSDQRLRVAFGVAVILAASVPTYSSKAFAQSDAWVSDCSERNGGTICHGWSVQGGDTLEAALGCTGATGGGVLSCNGRKLCELTDHVTVRGFETESCQETSAPAAQDDSEIQTEWEPDPLDPPTDAPAGGYPVGSDDADNFSEAGDDSPSQVGAVGPGASCAIRDPANTSANVRLSPNGEVVNRLRNGRKVTVAAVQQDGQGRPWMLVEGDYNGKKRRWGYVFGELLQCGGGGTVASRPLRSASGNGGERCEVSDPNDTSANVRSTPNGQIVNKLRNGRIVTVTSVTNDRQGRPWMFVEGEYEGVWREWGYVFGDLLKCGRPEQSAVSRPAPVRQASSVESLLQTCSNYSGRYDPTGIAACSNVINAAAEADLSAENLAKAYASRGFSFFDGEQWQQAIPDFDAALRLAPGNVNLILHRGSAHREAGNFDKALADYTTLIKIDRNMAVEDEDPPGILLYARSRIYKLAGRHGDEIADLDAFIELNPRSAEPYVTRGQAYYALEMTDLAIADYDKAIALGYQEARVFNNRGAAFADLRKFDRAIEDLNNAIRIDPDYANPYRHRGRTYLAQEKIGSAIADLDHAISLKKDYAEAYRDRGLAHEAKGDLELALGDFKTYARLRPTEADSEEAIARVQAKLK